MSKQIRISKKHGVNPTIPTCFWCGEPKNEIALLGRLPGDKEAPMHCCIDYEPCDKCEAQWNQGVAVLRASTHPPRPNMPPFQGSVRRCDDVYVDGKMVVIKREAFSRVFSAWLPADLVEAGLKEGICLLEDKAFDSLFANIQTSSVPSGLNPNAPTYDAMTQYLNEAEGIELECVKDGDMSVIRNKIDGRTLFQASFDKDNLHSMDEHIGHEIEVTEGDNYIRIECATCSSTLCSLYGEVDNEDRSDA